VWLFKFDSRLNDVRGGPLVFEIRKPPGDPLVTSKIKYYFKELTGTPMPECLKVILHVYVGLDQGHCSLLNF